MRIQTVKGLECVKFIEHVDRFASDHVQHSTASPEFKIQVAQAFKQKVIVLSRSICAAPQRGFNNVKAEHRPLTER
jgi:hypothetical protein